MKILVVGSGGREHALAWKIAQSEIVDEVFCVPGNPGMDEIGPCFDVDPTDLHKMQELVLQISPDLIVIGPEAPLAAGLSDALRARGFDVFGPSEKAAQLESSKGFSKDLMKRFDIPTAAYGRFTDLTEALDFLETMSPPYVIKADGLAAGKGVVICDELEEAENEVEAMMTGKFGDASTEIVIEEFMDGEEASIFVLTDGDGAIYLPPAQDHKRVGDGDTGPEHRRHGLLCAGAGGHPADDGIGPDADRRATAVRHGRRRYALSGRALCRDHGHAVRAKSGGI